jgi:hypothetical protein
LKIFELKDGIPRKGLDLYWNTCEDVLLVYSGKRNGAKLACDVHLEQEDIDEATHPRLLPRGWCGGCMAQALYDPLGLVSPLMIQFKLAIRNLCTED